ARGDHHPAVLELAAQLGLGSVDDARAAWERYVTALPLAFADHAARFYLGIGRDPQRALALAKTNFANRPSTEARALLVKAALAAGATVDACTAATPLANAPTRAARFQAWLALGACGRRDEAAQVAAVLGL